MAIYSSVPPPEQQPTTTTPPPTATNPPLATIPVQSPPTPVKGSGIDIDAWTISALQSLAVSPVARGTGTPLAIPIDETAKAQPKSPERNVNFDEHEVPTSTPRRPPSRRDSQRKRELVLKGKEGSRQRRRWENDRLMHVPNVQPPLPSDYEVHPTHTIHRVPYQLAQFWDRGVRQRVEDKTARLQAERKKQQLKLGSATGLGAGEVPRDLREATKRSPVVRSWVRSLEEPVRQYLASQRAATATNEEASDDSDSAADQMDSDDEEIVFVGRNGAMRELREKKATWKHAHREVSQETVDSGMLFDSFGNDESAAFKRWLTHTISDYYGIQSRSVNLTNPTRRVVYVGLKTSQGTSPLRTLPRPMWEVC
ncbi:R3H-associated N-terminal domain-containing protein [Fusarium flagelliforme]|uniref:R3h-associated protein n=1 Tax=Fusarium flagelliforme TaxID=2675880 RepID=A0A395N4F3_9HYPO|nr:R3H-associated N-terminal domain-containing protein [Fusarium flagelliforme]KAH7189366.1 R3H-associated N-terminal domain-containing protein [Fusarium flagelliforme]RFN54885.1 r3h-associated protein [Fusarium flagelliforme]